MKSSIDFTRDHRNQNIHSNSNMYGIHGHCYNPMVTQDYRQWGDSCSSLSNGINMSLAYKSPPPPPLGVGHDNQINNHPVPNLPAFTHPTFYSDVYSHQSMASPNPTGQAHTFATTAAAAQQKQDFYNSSMAVSYPHQSVPSPHSLNFPSKFPSHMNFYDPSQFMRSLGSVPPGSCTTSNALAESLSLFTQQHRQQSGVGHHGSPFNFLPNTSSIHHTTLPNLVSSELSFNQKSPVPLISHPAGEEAINPGHEYHFSQTHNSIKVETSSSTPAFDEETTNQLTSSSSAPESSQTAVEKQGKQGGYFEVYKEKRRKNNLSAKKSRKSRRDKEKSMANMVVQLEHDNSHLRTLIHSAMDEISTFKQQLDHNLLLPSQNHAGLVNTFCS